MLEISKSVIIRDARGCQKDIASLMIKKLG
jgi:predicted transposase YbfD/YdcC